MHFNRDINLEVEFQGHLFKKLDNLKIDLQNLNHFETVKIVPILF